MTTISPDLSAKIERRARRAWRRHRDGSTRKIHRISDITPDALYYRLPYTPDYYGAEKVKVVCRPDGTIEIDPKTTGLIDCQTKDDLAKLKKHGDTVQAYYRTSVGDAHAVKGSIDVVSREQAVDAAKPGDRVFIIEFHADDITHHMPRSASSGDAAVKVEKYDVAGELDQEKDLGFTVGLLDHAGGADLKELKKHIGSIRACLLDKKAKKSHPISTVRKSKKGDRFMSKDRCARLARPGDKAYIVELDYKNVGTMHVEEFQASECMVQEELDPVKDLGFTKGGLLDLRTTADVEKLRKHEGLVRAYKYTDKDAKSPVQTADAILYTPGKDYEIKDAVTDEKQDCAAGINVASVEWCKQFLKESDGHRAFAFEFHSRDIAAIPDRNPGKLRVFKCRCVEELHTKTFEPPKLKPAPPSAPPQLPPPASDVDDPPEGGFFRRLFGGLR